MNAPLNSFENVQRLYDRHRFLEAFKQSAGYWTDTTCCERLSSEELILGGRLAARLGGWRLSRWLYRLALKRDPSHACVRYFTRHLHRRKWSILDNLRSFEDRTKSFDDD